MPRLLFIANNYYNKENVASNRTSGLLKYLPEFGWEVTLITYHPLHKTLPLGFSNKYVATVVEGVSPSEHKKESNNPGDKQIKTLTKQENSTGFPQYIWSGVRKCWHFMNRSAFIGNILKHILELYYMIQYPVSSNARWKRNAIRLAQDKCDSEHFDAILSTHNLPESHITASLISKKYNIPWVADYRDLWSQNHYNTGSKRRFAHMRQLEIKTLDCCRCCTTVSQPLATDLALLLKKDVFVIPNGFEIGNYPQSSTLRPKFTITYLGSLYNGLRDPTPLLNIISDLIRENVIDTEKIAIDFYGDVLPLIDEKIRDLNLQKVVTQHGRVSKEMSIQMQTTSQILLLLTTTHTKQIGVLPGKMFEYLAAHRPILSMGYQGNCSISDVLEETGAGVHITSQEQLRAQLISWYNEWLDSGEVNYNGNDEAINCYSHRKMGEKFSQVLYDAISEI